MADYSIRKMIVTYKLNQGIGLITSPIRLIFPDGERVEYRNGVVVAEAVFDKRYVIKEMRAVENIVEIDLKQADITNLHGIGEMEVSFF